MTTLATRQREISDREGVDVIFKDKNGQVADPKTNGLPKYPYDKAIKGSKTVNDLKNDRLRPNYTGYDFDVLKGDGTVAAPQTTMETVRESYQEQ
ncbi:hypothetical protein [Acidithiobacillus sp.]|jgi:hypothetical protein|uniref:hypothetical protein n=1 Tax=Acidithiobacillus sp. TaxID=1872118 RepID=UPI0031FECDA0